MKSKEFLQRKYVTEGLSIQQIMDLTMSSKTTVKRYLKEFGIPLRGEDLRLGPPRYGERRLKGRKVQNSAEVEVMEKIRDMHEKGISATQIAKLLNTLALPTKLGRKWHAKTILKILQQLIQLSES
jgi:transposase